MAAHSFVRCQSVLASRDLSWKMGVLELHLIRARSARIAGAHHRRRPLCGWSCRGLWLLLASLQGSLSFGLCKLRPSSIALARLQSAQRLRLHLALLLRFEHLLRVTEGHRPGPAAGPGAPSAPSRTQSRVPRLSRGLAVGAHRLEPLRPGHAASRHSLRSQSNRSSAIGESRMP